MPGDYVERHLASFAIGLKLPVCTSLRIFVGELRERLVIPPRSVAIAVELFLVYFEEHLDVDAVLAV